MDSSNSFDFLPMIKTGESENLTQIPVQGFMAVNRPLSPPSKYNQMDASEDPFEDDSPLTVSSREYLAERLDEASIKRRSPTSSATAVEADEPGMRSRTVSYGDEGVQANNLNNIPGHKAVNHDNQLQLNDDVYRDLLRSASDREDQVSAEVDGSADRTHQIGDQMRPRKAKTSRSQPQVDRGRQIEPAKPSTSRKRPFSCVEPFDEAHANRAPRTLRKRTERQKKPYLADQAEYCLGRKGKVVTDVRVEQEMKRQEAARTKAKRQGKGGIPGRAKRRGDEDSSLSSTPPPTYSASDLSSSSEKPDISQVLLRTRFRSIFNGYIPIGLSRVEDNTASSLLAILKQRWEKRLDGRQVDHYVVSFSWLKADDNVIFEGEDNEDGYQEMLRKIASVLSRKNAIAQPIVFIDGVLEDR